MILTAEQKCLLWLSGAEVSAHVVGGMLETYHSAEGIWESFGKTGGATFHPTSRERLQATHSRDALDDMCARLDKLNVHLLFQGDESYPPLLASISDPPYLMYYAGRLGCMEKPCVAVVGSRSPSGYGREMAHAIASGLCEAGVCVVSGLAFGIDEAAHLGALGAKGQTVGVLGSGINNPYPAEHRELLRRIAGGTGLVLSEYPLDAEPLAYHFPNRNRIISGLSLGVVFVEGRIKSGGMRTVMAALDQGREVFAVPGRVGTTYSEGPHQILREGARIVTCAADVLQDLHLDTEQAHAQGATDNTLTPQQAAIIQALQVEPMNIDELSARLHTGADALITELGMLEILGKISREAGNRFSIPISGGR